MIKNRDDFEELCESIVSTVKVLQEKISRHGVAATTSLQQLCEELERLLDKIQLKVGQIQKSQKKQVLSLLKELSKSTSVRDELARYKTQLEKLRSDFILMSVAQLNINASVPVTQASLPPITTVCPPPSQMFHGRREILDKMHAYFSQDIGKRHVSLLHGLGGAGKTQICLKFLDETDKSRFTDVFFLDASGIDTIKNGLKNIALTRSIGSEDEDASCWLASSQDEWLLIFDNADDPSINLFNYFPQSSSGNILITSRNPELSVHAPNSHHHISDMEEEDAVQLLLASALQPLSTETESLATDIVKALYCFPLAVVQAGSFIARTGTLRKYLALYKQNRAKLLSMLPSQSHDKYAWSVYTTWDISFKCLGPLAARFLQICSFLHHESISEAIFSNAATYKETLWGPTEEEIQEPQQFLDNLLTQSRTWDELGFAEIIAEIRGYSLINQDPNTNLLSIHPMVHDWSSKTITDTTSTQQCCGAILAMSTMSLVNDQVFLISLLPHINSVLREDRQLAHKFPHPYQRVFYDSGHFDRAQELCVALLENRKCILGSEHLQTLFAMKELAAIYSRLGKFMDAEELKVAVLEKRKHILGSEHPDTLDAMSNLASTYHSLGKFTDAEELDIAVLEKRKQILGSEHPDTLDAMSRLATTYHSLRKFVDAEELQVAVLEQRTQILGLEHPKTLAAMSNLATTYHSLGKFVGVEELDLAVLEKRKQLLGSEHPDTLDAMSHLAATYWNLGKFTDAEELEVAVLAKRKQLFGTEHPDTLVSMTNLAFIYRDMGKFAEAEHLLVTVLEQKTSTLGPEHKETLEAQELLEEMHQHIENNTT
ncbi:P-loop containing nucleoside triphosphate hydrolase protein, partial [Mycena rebaudengoi]